MNQKIVAMIIIAAIAIAGCVQTPKEEPEIKIAVLAPLTGPNPLCGEDMRVGSELAMQAKKELVESNDG